MRSKRKMCIHTKQIAIAICLGLPNTLVCLSSSVIARFEILPRFLSRRSVCPIFVRGSRLRFPFGLVSPICVRFSKLRFPFGLVSPICVRGSKLRFPFGLVCPIFVRGSKLRFPFELVSPICVRGSKLHFPSFRFAQLFPFVVRPTFL